VLQDKGTITFVRVTRHPPRHDHGCRHLSFLCIGLSSKRGSTGCDYGASGPQAQAVDAWPNPHCLGWCLRAMMADRQVQLTPSLRVRMCIPSRGTLEQGRCAVPISDRLDGCLRVTPTLVALRASLSGLPPDVWSFSCQARYM